MLEYINIFCVFKCYISANDINIIASFSSSKKQKNLFYLDVKTFLFYKINNKIRL